VNLLALFATNAAVIVSGMLLLWLLSVAVRDASIVDIAWGTGFALIGILSACLGDGDGSRRVLVALLSAVWGLRLAIYLAWRNIGAGEDKRYAKMRASHGDRFWWVSLFTVFLLQGSLMLVIGAPLYTTTTSNAPLGILELVGGVVWATGVACETIADVQLARFKADPDNRGKVLDRGIWRYSRHPNYFGDCCVWWGLYLVAASTHWWTVFSPMVMTVFLLKISGVALLEKTIVHRRPAYRDYIERTSAFIPWPPSSKGG
jgi:steroid 5-alpha reductase family enzyme